MFEQRSWTVGELARAAGLRMVHGQADTQVADMTDDSRLVKPGMLFVARRGSIVDGRQFVIDAISAGAAVIVCADASLECGAAALLVPEARSPCEDEDAPLVAHLAEVFFGHPSGKLRIIGITGTNGKTTTAFLLQQLLNEARHRCGLMGTVIVDDGREKQTATLTTPSAIQISRTLGCMLTNGCTHLVMEVSSHALEQRRASAIHFDVGLFTNLSGDHLDYHATMDDYHDAKKILFDGLGQDGTAIVNGDDERSNTIVQDCKARVIRTTIGAVSPAGTLHREVTAGHETRASAMIEGMDFTGSRVHFVGPFGEMSLHLPLTGRHNVSNALQAACAAWACGVNAKQITKALTHARPVPGRLESVDDGTQGVRVFVDYAHTDAALDNVLGALRPIVPPDGRLTVVFGCGGDRDRTKRPRMAAVACKMADRIIITSDNPRSENTECIIDEIMRGVPDDCPERVERIADRREAIGHAISSARENEIIVIAGKGHEDYQIVGRTRYAFDDRVVAREMLAMRVGRGAGV